MIGIIACDGLIVFLQSKVSVNPLLNTCCALLMLLIICTRFKSLHSNLHLEEDCQSAIKITRTQTHTYKLLLSVLLTLGMVV